MTIAGAGVDLDRPEGAPRRDPERKPAGLPWAIVSTLLFGVATYVMGWAAKEAGFLPSLWFGRVTMMTVFLLAALVLWLRSRSAGEGARPGIARDAQARGDGRGGGAGRDDRLRARRRGRPGLGRDRRLRDLPAIPVLGGVMLLHERPVPTQYLGIAMVIGGLMLLGVA